MSKSSQLCACLLHRNINDINSLPEILSASSKQVLKSPSLSSIPWSRLSFVKTEKGTRDAGRWGTRRAYSFKSGPWGATIKMRGLTLALDGGRGCGRERYVQQPNPWSWAERWSHMDHRVCSAYACSRTAFAVHFHSGNVVEQYPTK